jgi:exosortase F-associated protein
MRIQTKHLAIGSVSLVGLLVIYLFQRTDISSIFGINGYMPRFIFNRSVRFLLNDICAMGIIYALFQQRKYLIFALWVQVAEILLFLIPYFLIRANFPAYNGVLISFLHRLIFNPILLLLLIPAFYYQRRLEGSKGLRSNAPD